MSLTGGLRAGDPLVFGRLYDEHAELLYTYCRAMVGDDAAAALRDAFTAATRVPGPGKDGLRIWLYGLARAECLRRDPPPFPVTSPLDRAAARLRREHREALVLAASLETAEVARLLGVATDTAEMLLGMARRRLAQAATAVVGADAISRLHELVTRRYVPPPALRDQVLIACSAAGQTAAGALLFDDSGMPIVPEALFASAEKATAHRGRDIHGRGSERIERVEASGPARPRKRSSGPAVLAVAVGAAVAVGILVLWPATGGGRTSNVERTNRLGRSSPPGASRLGGSLRNTPRPSRPPATGTPTTSPTPTRPGTGSPPPAPSPSLSARVTGPPRESHAHRGPHGPKPRG